MNVLAALIPHRQRSLKSGPSGVLIMKAYGLFLSAGLASALQIGNSGLNLGANALLNGSFDTSASNFDPAALGLNLGNLNVDGLNLGNLDFSNRDSMAQ